MNYIKYHLINRKASNNTEIHAVNYGFLTTKKIKFLIFNMFFIPFVYYGHSTKILGHLT